MQSSDSTNPSGAFCVRELWGGDSSMERQDSVRRGSEGRPRALTARSTTRRRPTFGRRAHSEPWGMADTTPQASIDRDNCNPHPDQSKGDVQEANYRPSGCGIDAEARTRLAQASLLASSIGLPPGHPRHDCQGSPWQTGTVLHCVKLARRAVPTIWTTGLPF